MQQCYAQRVHFVELLDAAEADLLSQPFQMNTCKVIGVTKRRALKHFSKKISCTIQQGP